MSSAAKNSVVIIGASSGIGCDLARRYLQAGAAVTGSYRNKGTLADLEGRPDFRLFRLDLSDRRAPQIAADYLAGNDLEFDLLIMAGGTMEPIGPFLETDDEDWTDSLAVNALMPLRIVKALYPYRRRGTVPSVAFFAGGGTNNPFRNYSAYCLSKIMLIKMCELLDDEIPDMKFFILGPGYVRTKIHEETLRAGEKAGTNLARTRDFLTSGGTPLEDIFACLEWCAHQERTIVSGRNFSVVHDPWRNGGADLAASLREDPNRFKLRRCGNF